MYFLGSSSEKLRKTKSSAKIIIALILFLPFVNACQNGGHSISERNTLNPNVSAADLSEYRTNFFALDTVITLIIYAESPEQAEKSRQAVEAEYNRIDILADRFAARNLQDPSGSDVYRINNSPGSWVKVSPDLIAMVSRALEFGDLSRGTFDIGLGRVSDLWDIKGKKHIPTADELAIALQAGNYKGITLAGDEIMVNRGTIMDLGGIAKGYATDKAVEKLKEQGIKHAIINAGGNVYAVGSKPDGKPWQIGIRHPRKDENAVIAVLPVVDASLVTSGDYERYFEIDGQRYHHIFDPQTGKPTTKCVAATVIAKSSTEADMMTKALMVMGPEKGMQFIGEFSKAKTDFMMEGVIIGNDLGITTTPGLVDSLIMVD